jgi:Uma2 family endonuclease
MSVATETSESLPDVPTEAIWRLSVAQYHQMIRTGILADDDPVEHLEGWLITKLGKNPPHRFSTETMRELLERMVPAGWYVEAQEPVTAEASEPERDIAVIRGSRRQFADSHPGAADLGLVIEVADSSLTRDRTIRKRIYAGMAIREYWIVNLIDRRVEVYTEPTGPIPRPD